MDFEKREIGDEKRQLEENPYSHHTAKQ